MGTDKDKKKSVLSVLSVVKRFWLWRRARLQWTGRNKLEPRMTRMGADKGEKKSVISVASVVKNRDMKHEELTHEIIGAAMAVLNELKPGLDEKLYENALVIELQTRGRRLEQQREYPVHYRGHLIGKLIPDLIVEGLVIVDPKVVTAFNETHLAQMLGYLNITGLEVALLLNFKEAKLQWKRVVRGEKEQTHG